VVLATLAMEAAAATAVGGDADPRLLPTLTKILKYFLDEAGKRAQKQVLHPEQRGGRVGNRPLDRTSSLSNR
jgi:hypothetical protein